MIIPSVFLQAVCPLILITEMDMREHRYIHKTIVPATVPKQRGGPSLGMHTPAVMSRELRTRVVRAGNCLIGRDNHINRDISRAHRDFTSGQHLFSQGQRDCERNIDAVRMRSSEPCIARP